MFLLNNFILYFIGIYFFLWNAFSNLLKSQFLCCYYLSKVSTVSLLYKLKLVVFLITFAMSICKLLISYIKLPWTLGIIFGTQEKFDFKKILTSYSGSWLWKQKHLLLKSSGSFSKSSFQLSIPLPGRTVTYD